MNTNLPTIREILEAPSVAEATAYELEAIMDVISDEYDSRSTEAESIEDLTLKHVISVSFEVNCGTQVSLVYFKTKPFAVIVRSGRGFRDEMGVYLVDSKLASEAVDYYRPLPKMKDAVGLSFEVNINTWAGVELKLGDTGPKGLNYLI